MGEAFEYLIGVLIFIGVLTASIALHEVGHLVPAKRFGVRVTQYMVGFGPTLWSMRRGETEYGIKGIPLGGYIMMIGMYPPAPNDTSGAVRQSSTGLFHSVVEDARRIQAEQVGPQDHNRVFYKLPVWQKLAIMLGGPLMNLIIGSVMLGVLVTTIGNPNTAVATTTVGTVYECIAPANEVVTACSDDDPIAPANAAGLLPGDTIVSAEGSAVESWEQMRETIRDNPGQALDLQVDRAGELVNVTLTPALTAVPVYADDEVVRDADGRVVTEDVGFAGFTAKLRPEPGTFADVPVVVADTIGRTVEAIFFLPQRLIDVARAAFGPAERDPEGPIGIVGIGRISGEVVSTASFTTTDKVAMMLGMLGGLNIFLCIFNLIPLLPFDGGHVAGALWEALQRRIARLRGLPDPGPVDVAKGLPVAYAVAMVLVVMSVLLLYADIVKPITLQ